MATLSMPADHFEPSGISHTQSDRSSSNGGWFPQQLSWATHQLIMAWQYMRQSVAGMVQTEHEASGGQGSAEHSSWLEDQHAAAGQLSWIPPGIRALPSKVPQLWHRQDALELPLTNQDAMQLDTQLTASSRRHSAHEGGQRPVSTGGVYF